MTVCAKSFRYRCDWRSRVSRPGAHRSALTGSGFEIRENALMRLGEDPRRLNLLRSARDPLQRLWVRRMQHTSTATLSVLADVSASMATGAGCDKYKMLLQFIDAAARSASANGDRFALHSAADSYLPSLSFSARRCSSLPYDLLQRLQNYRPVGQSAQALREVAETVGRKRGLVFLVSDFYWPSELISDLCKALWQVQLVPVMLCSSDEMEQHSQLLAVYRDAEKGHVKVQLSLPWQRRESAAAAHRVAVRQGFEQRGSKLLTLEDGFDANRVSAYFYS